MHAQRLRCTMKRLLILFGLGIILLMSCRKKETFSRSAVQLRFSTDTVFLDTVFASIGSSTRTLKVFNTSSEDIYINNIRLANGPSSYYRMNVNGTSTKSINDVELLANDSLYIFVEVTADVTGSLKLLYTDSILFNTGGVFQDVDLVTLAKDAYFHYANRSLTIPQNPPAQDIIVPFSILPCGEVWTNDKPHVVYGYAVVDSACSLTIEAGAEVHFHNGSGLWVYRGGQLQVDPANVGDIENNPVVFQGDRLEPAYENIPGQWGGVLGGIFIMQGSEDNLINHAIIKNGTVAIRTDSVADGNPTPNLILQNSLIANHSRVGLYGGYSFIVGENVVLANCGISNLYALGGRYSFTHSTFANYWNQSSRSTPSVFLTNFFEDGLGNRYTRDLSQAYFGNCIVYGNKTSEVAISQEGTDGLTYQFNTSLLRLDPNPIDNSYDVNDAAAFTHCILNQDPAFIDPEYNGYQLDSTSAAIDKGNLPDGVLVPQDILGNSRNVNGLPDMGAYEFQ